ncbi:MAG: PD-(D/E)XK nuclease family protein [Nanoarchaeota archaeon]
METYSHSRLSTFEQCKLKFRFSYIDKVETEIEETVEAFMGKRVHETLEKLYADLKFQKKNSLQDLLAFYNDEWVKNWNPNILIVRKEYDQENYRKMGEKSITDYYSRYQPFTQETTILTEAYIEISLDDGKEYKVRGYIDRISCTPDGTYYIHDYKTGNTLPKQEEIDQDRQLALYSIAVKENYHDCKQVVLVWHYLAFDKELTSSRKDEDLAQLKQDTVQLIMQVEATTEFTPKVSALCSWCQFQPLCPEWKHKFQLAQKELDQYLKDDGVKLANEYAKYHEEIAHIEEKMEQIRQALIQFAEKENVSVIFGSDVAVSLKKFTSLSFPKKNDWSRNDFVSMIRKLGLWDELATVDTYELAARINNGELHQDIIKLINNFVKRTENYRVSVRRK